MKPLIQIDDLVREMTDEELLVYESNQAIDKPLNLETTQE
jgi:hypothetical protein